MIRFILVVIGLTIVICKPFLLFLAALIALAWLLIKRPKTFPWLEEKLAIEPAEPETKLNVDKEQWAKEDSDKIEEADRRAEAAMKPNYKDDLEWAKLAKQINQQVLENQKKEENAMRLEELTDEVV